MCKTCSFGRMWQLGYAFMNEYCIVPDWLHNVFLGYGNPSAAQWTNMPDLLEMVDFKDTFLDADHLKTVFQIIRFAIVCLFF